MNPAIIFIWVLLGHFLGDYWLQNDKMARNKSKPGRWGFYACTEHVFVYTVCVLGMIGLAFGNAIVPNLGWLVLAIAIPHWLIDRYSLAALWMQFKNGIHPWKVWQYEPPNSLLNRETDQRLEQNAWDVSFAALIYVVTDNSLHLICLWAMILLLL